MKLSLIFVVCSALGCSGVSAVDIPSAPSAKHFCDINCQTGGLDGWYNVPGACNQDDQANPSASDWYMNCDGMTYTPYNGGDVACTMPMNTCQ